MDDLVTWLRACLDELEGQLPLIVPGGGLRDALLADVEAKRKLIELILDGIRPENVHLDEETP